MKHLHYIIMSFLFALCACKKEDIRTNIIDLQEYTENGIKNSDIFDFIECIPLETNNKGLLSDVNKVVFFNNEYYILDRKIQKCVCVFNNDGKFIRRIGILGHGHGEYPSIADFTIDEQQKRIIILSAPSRVYAYDLNGKFQFSKEISKSLIWNIICTKDGFIGTTNHLTYTEGDEAFLFFGFDKDFNETGKWEHVLKQQMYSPACVSTVLQHQNGHIYYWDNYTNSIFTMSDMKRGMKKEYTIKFSNPMPEENFCSWEKFMENQFKYDFIMEAITCGKQHVIAYIHSGKQHIAIVDENGKVKINGAYKEVIPTLFDGKDNELIYPISAESYLSNWKEKVKTRHNKIVSAGDNYLLLRLKVK